jgi:hypothetical protein
VHERPYIASRHIPHGNEQHPIRIACLEDRDDVRIVHGRRRPGFTNETVPECLIRRQRGREDLERHLPLKPLILGSEDNRHSSPANLLLQAVPGDMRTGGEAGQEPGGTGSLITHHAPRTRTGPPGSPASGMEEYGSTKLATSHPLVVTRPRTRTDYLGRKPLKLAQQ